MESTATDDITPKTPIYLRGTFYFYLLIGSILALITALLITVIALRWINPPTTSFMLQQNWEELSVERYSLRDHWVDYEALPKHSAWAVVASEDQLFWQHWGFDFESIQEAWEERQEGERSRGASSITQQVAKNIFLWPAESFFRKGVEAGITVLIELFWPKERIIEMYLNIAEFGPGVFGIGLASEQFFDRNASELEPDMTARLAAVLPNPKRMRVNPPSPYTKERSRWILRQMTRLSGISYIKMDSTVSKQASAEDSSALSDSLLNTQPINSTPLAPDSLLQDSLSKFRMQNSSTFQDTSADSIPPF
jgi:monofunctional biosynthetic peptidoglycan transglycosylase